METYELIIRTEFAAAHRLREYDGNCERLHGHNWAIDVVLRGNRLDPSGLLLDFRDAKRLVADILSDFDHQYLNERDAFRDRNPSSENIARTIYLALSAKVPQGVTVGKVTAWETDHCGASYTATP